MSSDTKIPEYITNVIIQALKFEELAKYYVEQGEVEGALINFLLASSKLVAPRDNSKPESTHIDTKNLIDNFIGTDNTKNIYKNSYSNRIIIKQDDGIPEININIDEKIKEYLSYIVPLQEKLKQLKINRNCNKEEDIDCPSPEEVPSFDFEDISGQEQAKEDMRNGILYPLMYPKLYPYQSKGILFYGPPGTGKTLLAKAFVNELEQTSKQCFKKNVKVLLYAPTGGELKGKYVGETEKNISKYFKCANEQAEKCINSSGLKTHVISVIFLDEIEAIAGDRSKDNSGIMTNSVNALLQLMDGVKQYKNVIVMAATNYPWSLDPAILRRFDTKTYVGLPNKEDVQQLIKIEINNYIRKSLSIFNPKNKTELTEKTEQKCKEDGDLDCGGLCIKGQSKYNNKVREEEIFNIYREQYFPEFTDEEIKRISILYSSEDRRFSGGDIKNACRMVFKMMADESIKVNKYESTHILNPFTITKEKTQTKLYDIIKDEEGKNKTFHLYSEFGNMITPSGIINNISSLEIMDSQNENQEKTDPNLFGSSVDPDIETINKDKIIINYLNWHILTSEFESVFSLTQTFSKSLWHGIIKEVDINET